MFRGISLMPTHFLVGPWQYRVRVSRDLVDADGARLMGRCDFDTHTIWVHADVKRFSRLNVVLHELRHAWGYHFPRARTEEEECDLSATIITAAFQDLTRMGGPGALALLEPEEPETWHSDHG